MKSPQRAYRAQVYGGFHISFNYLPVVGGGSQKRVHPLTPTAPVGYSPTVDMVEMAQYMLVMYLVPCAAHTHIIRHV